MVTATKEWKPRLRSCFAHLSAGFSVDRNVQIGGQTGRRAPTAGWSRARASFALLSIVFAFNLSRGKRRSHEFLASDASARARARDIDARQRFFATPPILGSIRANNVFRDALIT